MPEKTSIGSKYYFSLAKKPLMVGVLKYAYRYEYELPGICAKGYMVFEDSIIYDVGIEREKVYKLPMLYFRKKDNVRDKNRGEIIPTFTYLNTDKYGNTFQCFESANFSMIPTVKKIYT